MGAMGQLAKATNNQVLIESLGPWTAWHVDEYHSCLTEQSVHLLELLIHHEKNDIPWAQSNPGWAKPFV